MIGRTPPLASDGTSILDRVETDPYRRNDELRIAADGPRLLSREMLLTEVAIAAPNVGGSCEQR